MTMFFEVQAAPERVRVQGFGDQWGVDCAFCGESSYFPDWDEANIASQHHSSVDHILMSRHKIDLDCSD